jgi:hypothetical protein
MSKRKYDSFDDDGIFDNLPIGPQLRRVFIVAGFLALFCVMAALFWFVYAPQSDSSSSPTSDPIPIIRADQTPWKEKPQEEGGMVVPNADSTIFETLRRENGPAQNPNLRIESLLDDTEQPVQKEKLFPETTSEDKKTLEPKIDQDLSAPPQAAELKNENKSEPISPEISKPSEKPLEKPAEKSLTMEEVIAELKQTEPETKIEARAETSLQEKSMTEPPSDAGLESARAQTPPTPQITKPEPGSSYIQLASVKSDTEAADLWNKLKSNHNELKNLEYRVQRADLAERGIFFRLQAGPLSAQSAEQICKSIQLRGGNCLVIK